MTKITTTLKSVNKVGLAAILITAGVLMAFKSPENKLVNKKWGFNPSAPAGSRWVDITGQTQQTTPGTGNYLCDSEIDRTCTAEFEASVNPNSGTPTPSNVILGEYVDL